MGPPVYHYDAMPLPVTADCTAPHEKYWSTSSLMNQTVYTATKKYLRGFIFSELLSKSTKKLFSSSKNITTAGDCQLIADYMYNK